MPHREYVIQLETMLDHLTGEEIGVAIQELTAMPEVLDVIYIPAIGKKNRPCGLMQTLCSETHENAVVSAIFRHTHTLGIRRSRIERYVLPRETSVMEMPGVGMRVKNYELEGVIYSRPEADDVAATQHARGLGMPAARFSRRQGDKNSSG